MKIIPATSKDISSILLLIQEFFSYAKMDETKLAERIASPLFWVQKCVVGEKIIGYAEWEIMDEKNNVIRLNGIAVDKKQRGKGFGTALLRDGEATAQKKGFKKIVLLVKQKNARAKKLYRENGYTFNKIHLKKIEGDLAEEWVKTL